MKQNILLLLFLLFVVHAKAQVLKVEPAEVKQTFKVNLSDPFLDLELHATIRNTNATDTLRLKWQRKEIAKPGEWLTQVCDGVECFIPIVSSNIDPVLGLNLPFVLPPGSKADFIFHVLPGQTAGSGKYAIQFSTVNKPDSIVATMNFDVQVQNLVTSVKDWQLNSIQVYPNPASDYFVLNYSDGIDELTVFNTLGVPMKNFLAAPGQRYSLNGLPDGMYLIALISHKKGIVKTIRLSKRGLRS